jgi:hypothetical protein
MEINEILEERGSRYGDYAEVSLVSQNIKSAMRHSRNWRHLPADMKESLEMTANKLARLLNGDWRYVDNLTDCIGYLKLILDRLERGHNGTHDVNEQNQTENGN